jgi:hypothetical protein
MFDGLALNYKGGGFVRTDYSYGVMRFPASKADELRIPYGGNNAQGATNMGGSEIKELPFTGNGFLGNNKSSHNPYLIPEFQYPPASPIDIPNGTELYEVTQNGHKVLRAVFDEEFKRFVPTY